MGMPLEINSFVWKSKKENQECTSGDYLDLDEEDCPLKKKMNKTVGAGTSGIEISNLNLNASKVMNWNTLFPEKLTYPNKNLEVNPVNPNPIPVSSADRNGSVQQQVLI